ncbi:MAG: energy transducer TonB [Candidatus Zixiibacteriota bacterium]
MRIVSGKSVVILVSVLMVLLVGDLWAKRPKKQADGTYSLPTAAPLFYHPSGYPPSAAKAGMNADVVTEIRLHSSGHPLEVNVLSCTAPGFGFEDSARAAIMRNSFLPLSYYKNPPDREWASFTVSYRCYDGLIAEYCSPDCNSCPDTIPLAPDSLTARFKSDHIRPKELTFFPVDTTEHRIAEGDIYLVYKCTQLGQVTEAHEVFSTLHDTSSSQIALRLLTEGSVIFSPMPWTKLREDHLVRVSFRNPLPPDSLGKGVDSFVAIDVAPEMIYQVKPDFPSHLERKHISGVTWVKALVDSTGKVQVATIGSSSGFPEFDSCAVAAAYPTKYKPAVQNGHRVSVWVTYKVEYKGH